MLRGGLFNPAIGCRKVSKESLFVNELWVWILSWIKSGRQVEILFKA